MRSLKNYITDPGWETASIIGIPSSIYLRGSVLNQRQPTIPLEELKNDIDPTRKYGKQVKEVIQIASEMNFYQARSI